MAAPAGNGPGSAPLHPLYCRLFLQYDHLSPAEVLDDSAIVSLITNEDDKEYRELKQDFVDWYQRNRLQINEGKTKELVVDFPLAIILPPQHQRTSREWTSRW